MQIHFVKFLCNLSVKTTPALAKHGLARCYISEGCRTFVCNLRKVAEASAALFRDLRALKDLD